MNWEALGAIAELLGALGVIATLVYLAAQIRQNTTAQRSTSRLETTRAFTDWYSLGMTDPELLEVWNLALVERATLSDKQRMKLAWMMSSLGSRIEEMYTQCEAGLISEELYAKYRGSMRAFLEIPEIKAWWDSRATVFSDEFIADIESVGLADSNLSVLDVGSAVRGISDDA